MGREAGSIEQDYGIPTVAAAGENVVRFGLGPNVTYATGMPIRLPSRSGQASWVSTA